MRSRNKYVCSALAVATSLGLLSLTSGAKEVSKPIAVPHSAVIDLKVFPTNLNLSSKPDKQSVVVQAIFADGVTRDVTSEASFALKDKSLVRQEQNVFYPLADGKTELSVQYASKTLTVPVNVEHAHAERPISFKLDVMPIFMKAGCNAGSCHGSARGKDGFRLSLFGFDPDGDYYRLTREYIGRRVNLAIPEESLAVQKALGAVPHTGGERFTTNSPLYTTLLRWLQAGAPKDATNVAKVVALELMPSGCWPVTPTPA